MTANRWHEERLAELLGVLPPAPVGWVQAAQELPALRRTLEDRVARAESDAAYRAQLVADLEAALEAEGVEPTSRALAELRRRLEG
jgi:hypothetical protein